MSLSAATAPTAERLRRIRWRARRGLLENDIVLTRYLDSSGERMNEEDVLALDRLLDLTDPELLDLILSRSEPMGELDSAPVRRLLDQLRRA